MFPLLMDTQRDRLVSALVAITQHLDRPRSSFRTSSNSAADHRKFGRRRSTDGRPRAHRRVAQVRRLAVESWSWKARFRHMAS
jgi:hypothetical protein